MKSMGSCIRKLWTMQGTECRTSTTQRVLLGSNAWTVIGRSTWKQTRRGCPGMSPLSLRERQRPGRNVLGAFCTAKDDKKQIFPCCTCICLSCKHHISFTCFNDKNETFLHNTVELKCLESLGCPHADIWHFLQSAEAYPCWLGPFDKNLLLKVSYRFDQSPCLLGSFIYHQCCNSPPLLSSSEK